MTFPQNSVFLNPKPFYAQSTYNLVTEPFKSVQNVYANRSHVNGEIKYYQLVDKIIDLKTQPELPLKQFFNGSCFAKGTASVKNAKCQCQNEYHGEFCSVPANIWSLHPEQVYQLNNSNPRKIIMGLIVNHELQLTEVRIRQLASVVDVFVLMESSITSGTVKFNAEHFGFESRNLESKTNSVQNFCFLITQP